MISPADQFEVVQCIGDLGFSLVRFAKPPLGTAAQRFVQWLDQGFDGDMAYLARDREIREHPEKLLPQLNSIVVLAHPYASDPNYRSGPQMGRVSRYAWGEDYHHVLRDKLAELTGILQKKFPQSHWYISIDAQAVLEKAWAEKAGLGWMGKHTNIIHEEKGSYFFLSALLTDVDFSSDPAVKDRCGTCTQCIEVCPTKAIVAPYVLNANLCISYLTIEQKGPIPRELRGAMGNHIFGCDDCQEVCPWNRFSEAATEIRLTVARDMAERSLKDWLGLSSGEFKRSFKHSPLRRARWKGMMRNILVAAGNSGDATLAPLVAEKLNHPVALVRGHAVWAYGKLLGPKARPLLQQGLQCEADHWVREEFQVALVETSGP